MLQSCLLIPECRWRNRIPQRFMRCGFQELVSKLCYYKKPTAPLVSASAAVIAKPQPKRLALWFLSAAKFLLLNEVIYTFFKFMIAVYLYL